MDKKTQQLIEAANAVRKHSYAPYSKYRVGAAVLTKSGQVFLGVNVENGSYPLSVCAERTAVSAAVIAGDREIEAVAVVTKDGGTPCGGCRQVLNEFNPKMKVIVSDESQSSVKTYSLEELLPHSFILK